MKYYIKVLQNYANFSGRARRSEYWYFVLFNFIISIVIGLIELQLKSTILLNIYILAVLVPGLAVAVRRMHDLDKSGWFILIPFYNLILVLTSGTQGENKYGADPKNVN
jgi:uncharacterized membrane protein YhaH (DUF805 family)